MLAFVNHECGDNLNVFLLLVDVRFFSFTQCFVALFL